jgi:glycosyltransferase involved in cell wall biosynthesis
MANVFVADFSLALINRTGAYFVSRDVIEHLSRHFVATRYWRLFLAHEPQGILRRILGRAMLWELNHLALAGRYAPPRPSRRDGTPTLFFDPLYVLGVEIDENDIVLCHDVGPVTHPDLFDDRTSELYRIAYDRIKAAGPGMVFVSRASQSAFERCFGRAFRFMTTIPLYVRAPADEGEGEAPTGISPPFILTVGALEARKNYLRSMKAFARSGLHERGYSYVFCGARGNSARDISALAEATPGVRALGYTSDAQLRWLYRNAVGFVLQSLLEGFGLPALEAGRHGLVSVVSADSAQTEAVGEGAIAVDPWSVSSIADGLKKLVDMPASERARRLALVRDQAAALTLERYLSEWDKLLCASDASAPRAVAPPLGQDVGTSDALERSSI